MSSDGHSHFIVPLKYYVGTFIALLILTVFTVAISRVDLGFLNTPVALGIALIKMSCVAMFFMALKWEKGINPIMFIGAAGAVFIFFLLTFSDVAFRSDIDPIQGGIHDIRAPKHAGSIEHHAPAHATDPSGDNKSSSAH